MSLSTSIFSKDRYSSSSLIYRSFVVSSEVTDSTEAMLDEEIHKRFGGKTFTTYFIQHKLSQDYYEFKIQLEKLSYFKRYLSTVMYGALTVASCGLPPALVLGGATEGGTAVVAAHGVALPLGMIVGMALSFSSITKLLDIFSGYEYPYLAKEILLSSGRSLMNGGLIVGDELTQFCLQSAGNYWVSLKSLI